MGLGLVFICYLVLVDFYFLGLDAVCVCSFFDSWLVWWFTWGCLCALWWVLC